MSHSINILEYALQLLGIQKSWRGMVCFPLPISNNSIFMSSNVTCRNDGPVSVTGRSRELLSDEANA